MRDQGSNCRIENGVVLVELKLRKINQLFNTMDPSPFQDRDLDDDAEEYIVGTVSEISQKHAVRLVIHLPATEVVKTTGRMVASAIRRYFSYRMRATERKLRGIFREGRTSFAIGATFLLGCILARNLAARLIPEGVTAEVVSEGLLISGWVAMWKPFAIFLYEWWPVMNTMKVYRRLMRVRVEIRATSGGETARLGSRK